MVVDEERSSPIMKYVCFIFVVAGRKDSVRWFAANCARFEMSQGFSAFLQPHPPTIPHVCTLLIFRAPTVWLNPQTPGSGDLELARILAHRTRCLAIGGMHGRRQVKKGETFPSCTCEWHPITSLTRKLSAGHFVTILACGTRLRKWFLTENLAIVFSSLLDTMNSIEGVYLYNITNEFLGLYFLILRVFAM